MFSFVKPTLAWLVQQIFFFYETPQFIVTSLVCVMNQRHHSHCLALFALRSILLTSEVLSAVNINFTAFWDVAECVLIDRYLPSSQKSPFFHFQDKEVCNARTVSGTLRLIGHSLGYSVSLVLILSFWSWCPDIWESQWYKFYVVWGTGRRGSMFRANRWEPFALKCGFILMGMTKRLWTQQSGCKYVIKYKQTKWRSERGTWRGNKEYQFEWILF